MDIGRMLRREALEYGNGTRDYARAHLYEPDQHQYPFESDMPDSAGRNNPAPVMLAERALIPVQRQFQGRLHPVVFLAMVLSCAISINADNEPRVCFFTAVVRVRAIALNGRRALLWQKDLPRACWCIIDLKQRSHVGLISTQTMPSP
jgi:hypothetical protein